MDRRSPWRYRDRAWPVGLDAIEVRDDDEDDPVERRRWRAGRLEDL